ncbi:hypothetical protein P280DRAFT_479621 [Massarina eburnea CBS 473.64]|uniref:BTB domain-containing protein n=1 Tax=Massarina eburnea CBS 473.64 TaxID=1395130 RepID=A0A6A6S118_9PLEO|nr:hypothetical protein P280DRAFT_479621 [Massarina eburnea CBS 473.64]
MGQSDATSTFGFGSGHLESEAERARDRTGKDDLPHLSQDENVVVNINTCLVQLHLYLLAMPSLSPSRNKSPGVRDVRVAQSEATNFLQSIIKVVVGLEGQSQTFFVHERLVTDRAPFFEKALHGQLKESDDKIIELPDDSPTVFFTYLQLLYTSKLPIKAKIGRPDDKNLRHEYDILVELYVLAEKLQDVDTRNIAIDAMIAKSRSEKSLPGMYNVQRIFDDTSEGSPLRQFVIDLYAEIGSEQQLHRNCGRPPSDFLYELSRKLLKMPFREVNHHTVDTCDSSVYHVKSPDVQDGEASNDDGETLVDEGSPFLR